MEPTGSAVVRSESCDLDRNLDQTRLMGPEYTVSLTPPGTTPPVWCRTHTCRTKKTSSLLFCKNLRPVLPHTSTFPMSTCIKETTARPPWFPAAPSDPIDLPRGLVRPTRPTRPTPRSPTPTPMTPGGRWRRPNRSARDGPRCRTPRSAVDREAARAPRWSWASPGRCSALASAAHREKKSGGTGGLVF